MLAEEHFEDIPAHTKPSVVDESDENGDGAVDVDMVSVCVCLCCVEMMSRHCDFMLGHNAAISPTVLHKKTRAHTHTHTHTHTHARAHPARLCTNTCWGRVCVRSAFEIRCVCLARTGWGARVATLDFTHAWYMRSRSSFGRASLTKAVHCTANLSSVPGEVLPARRRGQKYCCLKRGFAPATALHNTVPGWVGAAHPGSAYPDAPRAHPEPVCRMAYLRAHRLTQRP